MRMLRPSGACGYRGDTPGDTTAPTITAFTLPATNYGLTFGILSLAASDDTGVTGYAITEDTAVVPSIGAFGALPTTITASMIGAHTYRAYACDVAGNISNAASQSTTIYALTNPIISDIASSSNTPNGATITWTTDVATDSRVYYGTSTTYDGYASDPTLATSHSISLTGLTQYTTYHYQVGGAGVHTSIALSGDNLVITPRDMGMSASSIVWTDDTHVAFTYDWTSDDQLADWTPTPGTSLTRGAGTLAIDNGSTNAHAARWGLASNVVQVDVASVNIGAASTAFRIYAQSDNTWTFGTETNPLTAAVWYATGQAQPFLFKYNGNNQVPNEAGTYLENSTTYNNFSLELNTAYLEAIGDPTPTTHHLMNVYTQLANGLLAIAFTNGSATASGVLGPVTIRAIVAPSGGLEANAGSDQTIYLPINVATLTGGGAGGIIDGYAWTQVSALGARITAPTVASTGITNLAPGTNTFQLVVHDTLGASAFDNVNIALVNEVVPATPNKTIVVMGSSTAQGVGASDYAHSWAGLFEAYVETINPGSTVLNIGAGSTTTYSYREDGYSCLGRPVPNTAANITHALSLNPDAIILCASGNDQQAGFAEAEIEANYAAIATIALTNGIPFWVTTTYPRTDATLVAPLLATHDWIVSNFASHAIEFMAGHVDGSGYTLTQFNVDGLHENDAGHRDWANVVIGCGIITETYA